jgi:hypothetical protein
MDKKFNYVYLTTNIISGKQYIGDRSCDCEPEKDKYLGSGIHYKRAETLYGKSNFEKVILEFFPTKQSAFNAQEKYIIEYNTLTPNGYNISPKGGHGCKDCWSEESIKRLKISSRIRKINGFQEKHHTEKTKEGNRQKHLGKKHSLQTIKKQSKSHKGKTQSKETKLKQSISAKHRIKVICEYCNKECSTNLYNRWHGNKCKYNT